MKFAVVAIGIPGSGKTTVLRPLAERYGLAYISRDDIRKEFFDDSIAQADKERVWAEANRRTNEALNNGQPAVLDSTFAQKSKREDIIAFLRNAGAEKVIGLYFETPLETAKQRNQNRDAVVKDDVLEDMYRELAASPPCLADGFDVLYRYDEFSESKIARLLDNSSTS